MDSVVQSKIRKILQKHWSIGPVSNMHQLSTGLVNNTYIIEAKLGKFIFQELGSVFSSVDVVIDQAVVGQYMKLAGIVVPELILTNEGIPFVQSNNRICKLAPYIDHDEDPKSRLNNSMVESAAYLLGQFHCAAKCLSYRPKFWIPHFHQTMHYVRLLNWIVVNPTYYQAYEPVKNIAGYLFDTIPRYLLPEVLPVQLIHGDPKLDNFLFRGNRAHGIIDLDTFMIAPTLIDLGDAFRSWMQAEDGTFDSVRADLAYCAYQDGNPKSIILTKTSVYLATKLLSLELATRFLIDYFEESYFKWDNTKYASAAEHNLFRCKYFIRYAKSIPI